MHTHLTTHSPAPQISSPRLFLQLEGIAIFASCIVLYAYLHGSLALFAILLLAPDLSALGYLLNKRIGALAYNIAHLYALPLFLGLISLLSGWQLGILLALIWGAHIGMDRAVGYGLKYADNPKDTHLRRF